MLRPHVRRSSNDSRVESRPDHDEPTHPHHSSARARSLASPVIDRVRRRFISGPYAELILNYFRAQKLLSSGVVEGLNNKAKVTMRKSYGFRTFRCLELALYHSLGKLPEPESTHDFF